MDVRLFPGGRRVSVTPPGVRCGCAMRRLRVSSAGPTGEPPVCVSRQSRDWRSRRSRARDVHLRRMASAQTVSVARECAAFAPGLRKSDFVAYGHIEMLERRLEGARFHV